MKNPNLFIVGGPKCGTTSMWYYLNQDKDVFMVKEKEPQYFNTDLMFDKRPTKTLYYKMFASASNEKYRGEASPLYLLSKTAAENIKDISPDAKIIIMVRRPSEILNSIYLQNRINKVESIPLFEDALKEEKKRRKEHIKTINGQPIERLFYSEFVNYAEQIKRFYKFFSPEQIHVIIFDDLKKDTLSTVNNVLTFLDLPNNNRMNLNIKNSAKSNRSPIFQSMIDKPPTWLSNSLRLLLNDSLRSKIYWKFWWLNKKKIDTMNNVNSYSFLDKQYLNKIIELEKLINVNLSNWKEK